MTARAIRLNLPRRFRPLTLEGISRLRDRTIDRSRLFGFQVWINNVQTLPSDFFSDKAVASVAGLPRFRTMGLSPTKRERVRKFAVEEAEAL